ncbi:glycoside hydrolase family 1 protein [Sorangium sp. So ce1151]|uniref:glycoside hydrolase family 1 protein n=1 Tax=Sorangium sp. So ce1151 TaxID=3133332 RepID=UPI003F623857
MSIDLPRDLILGVATSAHQIEGGDLHTDWWDFEQLPGRIQRNDRSGRAVEFWTRFREDVELMRDHGIQSHRMSVSWGRIEPEEGRFDEAALARYVEIVDAHRSAGIAVAVTLFHFALPRWLAARGGLLAPDAAERFQRFARRVALALRGRVWQWHTVNEPVVLADGGYRRGVWPPGERSLPRFARACRALLELHVAGYRAVHEVDDAPAGLVHNFISARGRHGSEVDRRAARVVQWCLDDAVVECLATGRIVPPWGVGARLDGLDRSSDVLGVNYYNGVTTCLHELPAIMDGSRGDRRTQMGWSVWASGLLDVLRSASRLGVPVFVTENGIATDDDAWRKAFLAEHLHQVCLAIQSGLDVRGYAHWSWIDNFEWAEGFGPRFGLVAVDPETLSRRPRESLRLYARIIRERTLDGGG